MVAESNNGAARPDTVTLPKAGKLPIRWLSKRIGIADAINPQNVTQKVPIIVVYTGTGVCGGSYAGTPHAVLQDAVCHLALDVAELEARLRKLENVAARGVKTGPRKRLEGGGQ